MSKISRYNHFQPRQDGAYIAYNARSGAVALMDAENFATYTRLKEKLSDGAPPELSSQERELLRQLEYGRFAYADDADEFEHVKFQHHLARYDQTILGFVIAPTLACNMACTYCYEGNKKGRMSSEVVDAIVEFARQRAMFLKRLDVGWYGGEPLLAMDLIDELTRQFLKLQEQHDFAYSSSMITNGYLLTPNTVDRLIDLKVETVQVTLDGPRRMHNIMRPLKNGRASYDTIIENLQYAVTRMMVGVRVNIDRSVSSEMVQELLDELIAAGLRERIGVYFGLLEPASSVCANITESCYDTLDFPAIETVHYRQLLENDFLILKLPRPLSTFCMAQNISTHLIDPEGNLYRCYHHVGDATKSYGNIREDINYQHPNFRHLFAFDPFEDNECRQCRLLPICMGGCPSRRADRGLTDEQMCEGWKHNLEPMLEIIARSKQQQQARAAARATAAVSVTTEEP